LRYSLDSVGGRNSPFCPEEVVLMEFEGCLFHYWEVEDEGYRTGILESLCPNSGNTYESTFPANGASLLLNLLEHVLFLKGIRGKSNSPPSTQEPLYTILLVITSVWLIFIKKPTGNFLMLTLDKIINRNQWGLILFLPKGGSITLKMPYDWRLYRYNTRTYKLEYLGKWKPDSEEYVDVKVKKEEIIFPYPLPPTYLRKGKIYTVLGESTRIRRYLRPAHLFVKFLNEHAQKISRPPEDIYRLPVVEYPAALFRWAPLPLLREANTLSYFPLYLRRHHHDITIADTRIKLQ